MKTLTFLSAVPPLLKGINLFSLNSIPLLIANIIKILLMLSGMLAVIIIVWAGIQLVVSEGNEARVKSARDTIQNAVIGLLLAAGAFIAVDFVASQFK